MASSAHDVHKVYSYPTPSDPNFRIVQVASGELDVTSLDDLGRHGKRLLNDFSEKHQNMIRRIFDFYDAQKIGYLTVHELEQLCLDCLEMALAIAPKQLPLFFDKLNKASAKMMQRLNDTGHVLTSEELVEAQAKLQERLKEVQQNALDVLRARVEQTKHSYRDLAASLLPRLKAPLNKNKAGTTGSIVPRTLNAGADDVSNQFAVSGDFVTQNEFLSQFALAAAEVLDPYYDELLNNLPTPAVK